MSSQRRVRKWDDDDDKNCWTRRSGLERKLIVLLIIIGSMSIGFLVYYSITRTGVSVEICNTPGCLLAASQIIAHIDTSADPCEDFFKFTCGNLVEGAHGNRETLYKQSIDSLIESQLQEIIDEPINEDDHYLIKSYKQLFQACMNETAIEAESLDIFKQTLEELRGWPVVVGYHWRAKLFDWQEVVYGLRERGYFYSMLLHVGVPMDLTETTDYTVVVDVPRITYIIKQHKDLYIKYMIDVAVAFGAEKNLANNEMRQVYDFMMKLESIVRESYNTSRDIEGNTFTVEEFQLNHNEIDWLEFLNTIVSPAHLSKDDYVLFPNQKFINKLFYLLYKTLKRTKANYIMWMVLQDIMPYMPKEIKQLQANYLCAAAQEQIEDRFDFCRDVIERSYLPGFSEILYSRRYSSEETQLGVEELFDNIKSAFVTSFTESTWMGEENKGNCSATAGNLTVTIRFDEDYLNDTVFENLVIPNDTLADLGDESFLRLLLKTRKRLKDAWFYQSSLPVNESATYFNLAASIFNVLYSPGRNTLILSPKVLQGVYYNSDKPNYLNYGALGPLIGRNLIKIFDLHHWTEETIQGFTEKIECFNENLKAFYPEDNQMSVIYAPESLEEYIGITLAYTAYNYWVEENAGEVHLPGIEYGPNQLFWISTMLPKCYMLAEENGNSDFTAGSIVNNPNFAADFNCPADARMNPIENCEML